MSYSNPGTDGSDDKLYAGSKGRPFVSPSVIQNLPLNGQNATGIRFRRDPAGFIWADVSLVGSLGSNGTVQFASVGALSQSGNSLTQASLFTSAAMELLNTSTTPSTLEIQRTPTTWKTVAVNASGSTTIWTPAAGKRYRLLGVIATLPSAATTAGGNLVVQLQDSGGGGIAWSSSIAFGALTASSFPTVLPSLAFPGNGFLGSAVNATLNAQHSAALTAGTVQYTVFGNEE